MSEETRTAETRANKAYMNQKEKHTTTEQTTTTKEKKKKRKKDILDSRISSSTDIMLGVAGLGEEGTVREAE